MTAMVSTSANCADRRVFERVHIPGHLQGVPRKGLLTDDDAGAGLHIGMVFQSGALFDSLTVGENVGFLLYEHSDLPRDRIQVRRVRSHSAYGIGLRCAA